MYNQVFESKHTSSMDFGSYGMGATINPMQNQLTTTNTAINWGLRSLEVGFMGSRWEGAPMGKLGELEREEIIHLAKLNKVNLTVHGPFKDAAGFNGRQFDEATRIDAVEDFKHALQFADKIGRETGMKNVPVIVHVANGTPGNPNPKEVIYMADKETGAVTPIDVQQRIFPREIVEAYGLTKTGYWQADKQNPDIGKLSPMGFIKLQDARMRSEMGSHLASIDYSIRFAQNYLDGARAIGDTKAVKAYQEQLASLEFQRKQTEAEVSYLEKKYTKESPRFVTTDEVAKEKVAQTAAELAEFSYRQLPSKPSIAIENVFPQMALGKPEEMQQAVHLAREKFMKQTGADPETAKKLISINMDIGHLNMWKRFRKYDEETGKYGDYYSDKDIKEWANKIYKDVSYVHLSDNYGDEDTHLPVGWGTAPIKEIADKYKKQGFKGRMILETSGGPNAMMSGIPYSLQSMGFPISPTSTWETAAGSYFQAGYAFTGFQTMPDVNFQVYGTGFSGLPYATGAQIPGSKEPGSQFSGAPVS